MLEICPQLQDANLQGDHQQGEKGTVREFYKLGIDRRKGRGWSQKIFENVMQK